MKILSSIKRFLPPNVSVFVFPTLFLVILAFLYSLFFKIGYSQTVSRIEELGEARRQEVTLKQKLEVLQQIQEDILEKTDVALSALPEQNSGLWMLLQVRRLAEQKSMLVSKRKVGAAAAYSVKDEDLSKVQISFDARGPDLFSLIEFFNAIKTLAPLSSIEDIKINQETPTAGITASVNLWTYWAPFPEKLPPITVPIRELTEEELGMLSSLSTLTTPELIEVSPSVSVAAPGQRPNPFSF